MSQCCKAGGLAEFHYVISIKAVVQTQITIFYSKRIVQAAIRIFPLSTMLLKVDNGIGFTPDTNAGFTLENLTRNLTWFAGRSS